jgi:hypothetical protein
MNDPLLVYLYNKDNLDEPPIVEYWDRGSKITLSLFKKDGVYKVWASLKGEVEEWADVKDGVNLIDTITSVLTNLDEVVDLFTVTKKESQAN